MKYILLLISCSFFMPSYAQTDNDSNDQAVIYIYRPGQYTGVMHNWDIYINGVEYCKLSNKRQIIIAHDPGKLNISTEKGGLDIQSKKKDFLTLETQPGDTIYIRGDVKSSLTRFRMELSRVFPDEYKDGGADLTIDNCQVE